MWTLLFTTTLLFNSPLFAVDLPEEYLGTYTTTSTHKNSEYQYLDCEALTKRNVNLYRPEVDLLIVDGLTHTPYVFEQIDNGTISSSGFNMGKSQRKSTSVTTDHYFEVNSYHRNCEGDFTGLSCHLKNWLNTATLAIQLKELNDGAVIEAQFTYQPFWHVPAETCTFSKFIKENDDN